MLVSLIVVIVSRVCASFVYVHQNTKLDAVCQLYLRKAGVAG